MRVFNDDEIKGFLARLEKAIVKEADMWSDLPFAVSHTLPEVRAEWPPLPWLLKSVLLPYVFAWRYSG